MRPPRWLATLPLSLAFHVAVVTAGVAFFRMESEPPGLILDLDAIIAERDDGPPAPARPAAGAGAAAPRPAARPTPAAPRRAPSPAPATPSAPATAPPPTAPTRRAEQVAPRVADPTPATAPEPPSQTSAPSGDGAPSQPPIPSQIAPPSHTASPHASAATNGAETGVENVAGTGSAVDSASVQGGTAAAGSGAGGGERAGSGAGGDQVASVPPGSGGLGTAVGSEYASYLARVRLRIQESLRYPPAARRRGITGTVQLEIAIAADGAIAAVSLVASSSHEILDRAALDAARALPRMPFPADVRPRPLTVRLPVVFALQ